MRLPQPGLVWLLLGLAALPTAADTIILKNGRRIVANSVREEGSRVSYETEAGTYALPRSLVARIEKQGSRARSAAPRRATSTPLPPIPLPPAPGKAPVLPGGELDHEYLEALARQSNLDPNLDDAGRRRLATVFLAAIEYEMRLGRTDAALALARQGVSSFPGNPHLTVAHGALLLHKQQYQAAREWLLRARLVAPNSPQVWKFLGFAEYFSDRTDDAIRAWRKSLSLAPDSDVQRMLERAQRETVAETHYEQTSSGHFTLRFEGRQVAPTFRREILEVLERHYQELDRQLDASLRAPIVVILYTDQAFRDVTRAPAWAGALNNGRMRIPVEGLSGVTSQLSSVLKHELVHSLVWAKTEGQCPAWLNEGLAQVLEGASVRENRRLAELRMAHQLLPWPGLEESFVHLGPGMASVAYAQSLAAVEFLVRRYGMHELERLLNRLAEGRPVEAALQSVYRLDYPEMDRAVGEWLRGAQ